MTTIYLVTSGEYSDYCVEGVFSSEKLAKEFAVKSGGEIEPWVLDERSVDRNCHYWLAVLHLATGNLSPRGGEDKYELANPKTRAGYVKYDPAYKSEAYPKGCIYSKSYVSQEHANKLCVEKKQEIQRQGD